MKKKLALATLALTLASSTIAYASFNVRFHANTGTFPEGGAVYETTTSTTGVDPRHFVDSMPVAPIRLGYTFLGWHIDQHGSGSPFTADTVLTGSIDLFAHWRSHSPSAYPIVVQPQTRIPQAGVAGTVTFRVQTGLSSGRPGWELHAPRNSGLIRRGTTIDIVDGEGTFGITFGPDTPAGQHQVSVTISGVRSEPFIFELAPPAGTYHSVSFDMAGGFYNDSNQQIHISVPNNTIIPADRRVVPSLSGYQFMGWQNTATGQLVDISTTAISGPLALRAHFVPANQRTLTFVPNGGVTPQGVGAFTRGLPMGQSFAQVFGNTGAHSFGTVAAISRPGFNFAGWRMADGQLFNQHTPMPATDTTIHATWRPIGPQGVLLLQFDPGQFGPTLPGGVTTVAVAANQTLRTSAGYHTFEQGNLAPTWTGFDFVGWELPSGELLSIENTVFSPFTFSNQAPIVLTPRWSPVQTWTLAFSPNGGAFPDGNTTAQNMQVARGHTVWTHYRLSLESFVPTPVRAGYTFGGWFVSGGTQAFTAQTAIQGHLGVAARWLAPGGAIAPNEPTINAPQTVPGIPSLMPAIPNVPVVTPDIAPTVAITDVNASHWASQYIAHVAGAGIFAPLTPGQFAPDANMTRAMFAQVLFNLEGASNQFQTPQFSDVAVGAPYFDAVQWASVMGIIQGLGDGRFNPHGDITREEIAVLLHRYTAIFSVQVAQPFAAMPFTDQSAINHWANDAVTFVQTAGLVSGNADGSFAPRQTATRAQVAAIVSRFMNR